MNLIALHGFLGSSSDFDSVVSHLKPKIQWVPDLFGKDKEFLSSGFEHWIEMALSDIESRFRGKPIQLMGYSLGGRLALHLVMAKPDLFEKVILLSTHPGIFDPSEILKRREWEGLWQEKLASMPLYQFAEEWLSQPLFMSDENRFLNFENFDRKTLLKSFESFSNTQHRFTLNGLQTLQKELIWVAGKEDQKFLKIAECLKPFRSPQDQFLVIPEAGHRLIAGKDLTWLYNLFS